MGLLHNNTLKNNMLEEIKASPCNKMGHTQYAEYLLCSWVIKQHVMCTCLIESRIMYILLGILEFRIITINQLGQDTIQYTFS